VVSRSDLRLATGGCLEGKQTLYLLTTRCGFEVFIERTKWGFKWLTRTRYDESNGAFAQSLTLGPRKELPS
jgi:hypothetical protein